MLAACLLTLRQLPDPAFLGPLFKGFLGAVAVFAGFATILVATTLGAARRSTSSSDGRCETTADHHSR